MTVESAELLLTGNFYKTLLDSIFDAVYVVDVHGNILYWNDSCARITGYTAQEMIGYNYTNTPFSGSVDEGSGGTTSLQGNDFPIKSSPAAGKVQAGRADEGGEGGDQDFVQTAREKGHGITIVLETGMPGTWKGFVRRKNGQRIPVESHISAIRNEKGQIIGAIEVFRDITALVSLEDAHRQLLHMSRKDKLTGLFNRTAISDILKAEIERARRYQQALSVVMVDIDFFKRINDQYGHDAGDKVLAKMGSILRHNLRLPDVVGRWGGEEFLVIAPNSDTKAARILAERIRQVIKEIPVQEWPKAITASFGVAQLHADMGHDQVLYQADMALYEAKRTGRDRVAIAGGERTADQVEEG